MWICKLFGAATLACSGMLIARELNGRATAARDQNEGWMALIRTVRGQIECFAKPIGEILAGCEAEALAACGYFGADTPSDLLTLLSHSTVHDPPTLAIVTRFAEEFGRGYREDEVRSCDYALSLLEARRATLAGELPLKKKRNAVLCVCAALALALLLL